MTQIKLRLPAWREWSLQSNAEQVTENHWYGISLKDDPKIPGQGALVIDNWQDNDDGFSRWPGGAADDEWFGLCRIQTRRGFLAHLGLGGSVSHLLGWTNAGIYRGMAAGLREIYRWTFSWEHLRRIQSQKRVAMCNWDFTAANSAEFAILMRPCFSCLRWYSSIRADHLYWGECFFYWPFQGFHYLYRAYHQGKFRSRWICKFWNSYLNSPKNAEELSEWCRNINCWFCQDSSEGGEGWLLCMSVVKVVAAAASQFDCLWRVAD